MRDQWISVKERLPDSKSERVLIFLTNYGNPRVDIGYYDGPYDGYGAEEGDQEFTDSDSERTTSVTHWMPLPEPPKQ